MKRSIQFYKNCVFLKSCKVVIAVSSIVTVLFFFYACIVNDGNTTEGFHVWEFDNPLNSVMDNAVADFLYKKSRVLCWVITSSHNYYERARHVRRTWGKRCNKLLLMGSQNFEDWDSIALPVSEGRKFLWSKTQAALNYIYENHRNDADWFLKADDDTYIIMENLRYFLYPYNSKTPIYFGRKFMVNQAYMSGGAGYVLSREALKRFFKYAPSSNSCHKSGTNEDFEMGICLNSLGVILGDTRDQYGWQRFYSVSPHTAMESKKRDAWLWTYQYYKGEKLCCSEYTISFHYVTPSFMYDMEVLLYHVKVYGIVSQHPRLPKVLTINATMPPPIN